MCHSCVSWGLGRDVLLQHLLPRDSSTAQVSARLILMSVERNVKICDGHHAPPVVLLVPDVSVLHVLHVLLVRVRTYAHAYGWTTRRGLYYCPECSRRPGVGEHDFGTIVRAGEAKDVASVVYNIRILV
jgi:hypothetical protein